MGWKYSGNDTGRAQNAQYPEPGKLGNAMDAFQQAVFLYVPMPYTVFKETSGEYPDIMAKVEQTGDLSQDKGFRQLWEIADKRYFHISFFEFVYSIANAITPVS